MSRPPRQCPAPAVNRPPAAPVWLPWILAPGFLCLPLGGCGLAAQLRRPTVVASVAPQPLPGPEAPAATMVTVVTPGR